MSGSEAGSSWQSSSRMDDARSRSSSFAFVAGGHPYRTSSLNELHRPRRSISRCGSARASQYSDCGPPSRQLSARRKGSLRSSSNRSRRSSYNYNIPPISSKSLTNSRRNSYYIPSQPPIIKIPPTDAQVKKQRRHRIAVWLVIGSFIFIVLSSILVVVVTLTHRTELDYGNNETVVYYTFSKPSSLINKPGDSLHYLNNKRK